VPFSELVSLEEKREVVAALLKVERKEVEIGKPDFPVLLPAMKLSDFVGKRSWVPFNLMCRGTDWMAQDPAHWHNHPQFVATKVVVDALLGVNDPAERGCHLAGRFKVSK
jgi:hypothetical protein